MKLASKSGENRHAVSQAKHPPATEPEDGNHVFLNSNQILASLVPQIYSIWSCDWKSQEWNSNVWEQLSAGRVDAFLVFNFTQLH